MGREEAQVRRQRRSGTQVGRQVPTDALRGLGGTRCPSAPPSAPTQQGPATCPRASPPELFPAAQPGAGQRGTAPRGDVGRAEGIAPPGWLQQRAALSTAVSVHCVPFIQQIILNNYLYKAFDSARLPASLLVRCLRWAGGRRKTPVLLGKHQETRPSLSAARKRSCRRTHTYLQLSIAFCANS